MINRRKNSFFIMLVLQFFAVSIIGCGTEALNSASSIEIPEALRLAKLPTDGTNRVYIYLDSVVKYEADVPQGQTSVTTTFEVAKGDHLIAIEFKYSSPFFENLVLAVSSKSISSADRQIQFTNYNFPDDDVDGFNNLAEVVAGSSPFDKGDVPPVAVPDVVGVNVTSARQAIIDAGFVVGAQSEEFSSTVPVDYVITQTPAAGEMAAPGSEINLVISLGPPDTNPPLVDEIIPQSNTIVNNDVVISVRFNESMNPATLVLGGSMEPQSNGGSWSTTNVMDDTLTIQANTLWNPGLMSTLIISVEDLSANPLASLTLTYDIYSPIPNVVGQDITLAQQSIVGAGFTVGNVSSDYSTTVPVDNVISQNPAANAVSPPGTSVNLVVSLGPPDTTFPTAQEISPESKTVVRNTVVIRIRFSETMNVNSLVLGGIMAPQSNGGVWSTTNVADDTLTIQASNLWAYGLNSTLSIDADDVAGNALSSLALSYDIKRDNLAFVTSVSNTGNLSTWPDAGTNTGLAAADAICQARATAANLPGSYRAWLSSSAHDAYCRIHELSGKKSANCGLSSLPANAGPWIRTNGTPFSDRIDTLVNDLKVFTPLWFDEFGNEITASERYFTGTDPNGEVTPPGSLGNLVCNDWASNVSTVYGNTGITDGSGTWWTSGGAVDCAGTMHLACFQTGPGPDLPNFQTAAKKVFLTTVAGTGDLSSWADAGANKGIAAGDAICQARAAAGGLANAQRFKAWLSDSSARAADRITSNGPWARPDGILVAQNKTDLLDGRLLAAIFQSELGTYISNFSLSVHTGTTDSGNATLLNCADWTDGTANMEETYGSRLSVAKGWSEYRTYNCSRTDFRLFCFED